MKRTLSPLPMLRANLGVLCCLICMWPAGHAFAQQTQGGTTEEPVRATSVELMLDGESVVIAKSDGWIIARAPKGSIALLRSAGDQSSQLDVRYTPGIDSSQRDGHFSTFHTNLKSMGLKKASSREVKLERGMFTDRIDETVYELTAKKKPYRLVVWHVHRKNAVWFFTLFEPAGTSTSSTEPLEVLVTGIKVGK